jgi:chromosome segregation ATPase
MNQYLEEYQTLQDKSRDGLNVLSKEQLVRMHELERLMGTTQDSLDSLDAQLHMVVNDILSSATSISELETSTTSLIQNGIVVDYSIYADALVNLASEYDNCTNEIQEFQAALNSNNAELMESKQQQLEAAIAIGEAANEYGIAEDTLEDVADGFEALAESGEEQYTILKEDGEALSDASIRYIRLNEAVLDLANNYDDYSQVLKDISESTDEMDKAMIANSKSGKAL